MPIDRIFELARLSPEKPAVIAGRNVLSYARFAGFIATTREHLAGHGVEPGELAVLPTAANLTTHVLGLALRSLGVTTLAVQSVNWIRPLDLPPGFCVVAVTDEHGPGLARLCAEAGWRFIGVPAAIYADTAGIPIPAPPDPGAPVGGHVLLTSGTTGSYKKVILDPAHRHARYALRRELFELDGRSVVSLFHAGDWTAGGHNFAAATWDAGGAVVIAQRPERWMSLQRRGITHAVVFPKLLAEILEAPPELEMLDDAMRLIVLGGPLSEAMAEQARKRLTSRIYAYVGSTEASAFTLTRVENPEDLKWHRVLPSRIVEVVDDSDRVLPAGSIGLLRVDQVPGIAGYLHDPEASRAFFPDGWFYPGDLGMRRADGRLALIGRASNVISVLGAKIAAEPIEEMLQRELPGGAVCLFSLPNDCAEEEVHVAIEQGPPIDQARLSWLLRRALPDAPRFVLHRVPSFPRNHLGKVQRLALMHRLVGVAVGAPAPAGESHALQPPSSGICKG